MDADELQQLRQENELLRLALQGEREVGQYHRYFLARVAHELRSPLSTHISLLQLMVRGLWETPEEQHQYLQEAQTAAERLLAMVDEVVMVTKVAYGTVALRCEPVNLQALVQELVPTLRLMVANQNLRIEVAIPREFPPVYGDRAKLLWILRSLISASLRWTPPQAGHIRWRVHGGTSSGDLIIDGPCPFDAWHQEPMEESPAFSPATVARLGDILLQAMGGTLVLTPLTLPDKATPATQLTLTLPFAPIP